MTVISGWNPICSRCGKYKYDFDESTMGAVCTCPPIKSDIHKEGWICPRCDRVLSPYVDECKECNEY